VPNKKRDWQEAYWTSNLSEDKSFCLALVSGLKVCCIIYNYLAYIDYFAYFEYINVLVKGSIMKIWYLG